MAISVGDKIPAGTLKISAPGGTKNVSTDDPFGGTKVVRLSQREDRRGQVWTRCFREAHILKLVDNGANCRAGYTLPFGGRVHLLQPPVV